MYRFTSDQFNFLPFIQRIGAREHDATRLDIDPALVRKVSLDELMTESTQALAKNILSSLGRISLSNLVYFLSAPLSTIEVANRLLVEDRRISIETAFQDELANAIKSQLAQLLIKQCKKDFTFRIRISRKEAKESIYFLRLMRDVEDTGFNSEFDNLIPESIELTKIFSSIIEKSK